jgi:hypothetical protein
LRLSGLIADLAFLSLFFIPMGMVALAHGFVLKYDLYPSLKVPLDLGYSFRGKRIFGDNKTIRGVLVHLLFSLIGTFFSQYIQAWLLPSSISLLDLSSHWLKVGLIFGLGMSLGELPNSFVKRQLGIRPGERPIGWGRIFFFVMDQVDMVLGIWIFFFLFFKLPCRLFVISLILSIMLHPTVTWIGYMLGMRKTPH